MESYIIPGMSDWASKKKSTDSCWTLFNYLAGRRPTICKCRLSKEIYVTEGKRCFQASPNTSSPMTETPPLKSNQLEADPRTVFYAAFASPAEARGVVCKEAYDADAYGQVLYFLLYQHRKVYFRQGKGSPKDSVMYYVKTAVSSHLAEVFVT